MSVPTPHHAVGAPSGAVATPAHQLGAATAELRRRLVHLPVAKAMGSGTVDRSTYARLLGQLMDLHETIETYVLPRLPLDVLEAAMIRTPALRADLDALGLAPPPRTKAEELLHAEYKALLDDATPAALVGAVYVLEGTREDSAVLYRPLAKALGVEALPGKGLDYHITAMAETPMRLRGLKSKVNQALADPAQIEAAAEMAQATMTLLYSLYQSVSVPRTAV